MRRILTILLLFICSGIFGQDIKPISPNFKALQSPSFSYFTTDSSVWIYKGVTYGWTKLVGYKHKKTAPWDLPKEMLVTFTKDQPRKMINTLSA